MQGARMGCPLGEHKNFVTVQPDSTSRGGQITARLCFSNSNPRISLELASFTNFSCVITWSHALSSAGSHLAEPGRGSRSI